MDIPGVEMKLGNLLARFAPPVHCHSEKGAITVAETLIVLGIGLVALTVWAQAKLHQLETVNAGNAGRAIAAYSRAASVWLAENPPATDDTFTISDLQDCANPVGARFLSCTFGPQTPIAYAQNDAGNPVNYGNLEIDVAITPAGATGVIDFGVIRSGGDENEDGLPDSRPDLASIAFQTAAEETGAGVLGFFEMMFVRESPTGLQFDPDEADFDQAAIDDLSRLQARVGAQAGDVPFLRLDGANQMAAGITFNNGMQVNMDGGGLVFQGPGDVEVQTDTGTLVVAQNIQTAALQSDSAVIDELTVEPADGVQGSGFDRFNQAPDVVRIDGDVIRLTARVQVNETDIASNRQNTAVNAAEITRLSGEVTNNLLNIETNRQNLDDQGNLLGEHDLAITALESVPPTESPDICAPLFAAVQLEMGGLGHRYSTSCGTYCNPAPFASCPEAREGYYHCSGPSSANPVPYAVRDVNTLACETRTAKFYSSRQCRKSYSGNPCK